MSQYRALGDLVDIHNHRLDDLGQKICRCHEGSDADAYGSPIGTSDGLEYATPPGMLVPIKERVPLAADLPVPSFDLDGPEEDKENRAPQPVIDLTNESEDEIR